ncbi:protein-disulfide reductase DsbD domain-containing protein [Chthonobacter rhizosphaerae]|uniref:protein-disulfide reductase DsbD domain-containing protein n=1 Tax=Chthonobacter rhizosphaerae TaxID=2735553 RepID=UPI0015EE5722
MSKVLFRLLAAGLLAVLPGVAGAGAPSIPHPEVSLLVAGGGPGPDGRYRAAVRMDLADGWHTYWRHPGDAGLPPVLDTAGSGNLAGVEVRYPAPERYFDGFGTSIVYHGRLVLPILVAPADPARPVSLRIDFRFGFCREVCVPGAAVLEATLDPAAPADPAAAALVDAALARVPAPEQPGLLPAVEAVTAIDPETVEVRVRTGEGAAPTVDLFVEPPADWYIGQPEPVRRDGDLAVFSLSLGGRPKTARTTGTPMRFTVTTPDGGVEATRPLP